MCRARAEKERNEGAAGGRSITAWAHACQVLTATAVMSSSPFALYASSHQLGLCVSFVFSGLLCCMLYSSSSSEYLGLVDFP